MRRRNWLSRHWIGVAVILTCGANAHAALGVAIDVGTATVAPGGVGIFAVQLRTMGAEVVGTENEIAFSSPIRIVARPDGSPDCAVDVAIHKEATTFRFLPIGCSGNACKSVRVFVLSFESPDPIQDGSVLYTCHVQARSDAAPGTYPLVNSYLGASDSHGTFLRATGKNGTVTVSSSSTTIDVSDAEAAPGGDAMITVSLHSATPTVVAAQNRIDFSSPLRIAANAEGNPDCFVNPTVNKPATNFRFLPAQCVGTACTAVRAVVLSFDGPTPIANGSILYTCRVVVDDDAPAGSFTLRNSETAGSDAHGALIPAGGRDGVIMVQADDADVAVSVGTTRAVSGQRAFIPVRLDYLRSDAEVAGTQNELVFSPGVPIAAKSDGSPDCQANPDIHKDASDFLFLPIDCTPGVDCERVRAFVLALDNTDPIPDGSLLYRCAVQVGSNAVVGRYPMRSENAVASDSRGQPVSARDKTGALDVICAGDCDANGQVAIFELLRGVNILLGNDSLLACPTFDSDAGGDVNVNEVVQAVSSALRGCRFAN